MSSPSPDEVAGYFEDPSFPRLPPACGAQDPDRPEAYCERPVPCYGYHEWLTGEVERFGAKPIKHTWPNPEKPPKAPKPETGKKQASDIAKRVEENVRASTPANGSLAEALARVNRNASPDFMTEAKAVCEVVAHHMEEFTSEDVLERVEAETHDNRAMGPVMLWAKNQGLIEKTERFSVYRKESNHQQDTRIWRSLVYKAPVAELADATASSTGVETRAGSTPAGGTSSVTIGS